MSTAPLTFASLIDHLREEIGRRHLTQSEAAAELGVSERTLQYWLGSDEVVPRAKHRRAIVSWLEQREAA